MSCILDLAPAQADDRVQYGPAPQQFIDIRRPNGIAAGAVLNIHGGFWRNRYDLAHAGHFCAALTESGYATYNVEYRRVGDDGGGWPGTLDDLRCAYACIRQHLANTVIAIGHSAGGQLAFTLAAHEPGIACVISLAGVLDLRRAYELHLGNDAVVDFLGGTPAQVPERYREASPSELKVAALQIVVTGDSDEDVLPQLSRDYVREKKQAGEKVELVEIARADHFDLIDPRSTAFSVIRKAIDRVLT